MVLNIRGAKFMQRWQWEVVKMFLYMSFPVGCFHYFNSPQIFEEAVTKAKRETFQPTPVETREKIEAIFQQIRSVQNLKSLDEMEKNMQKNKAALEL